MLPSFKPGQIVFARKTRNLSINDVVVLKTHDNSQIIKRISKIQDTEIRVSGDNPCLLYTSPSPRDLRKSRMPSSA